MDNPEKIKILKKEIKELEDKKMNKNEFEELLKKRNELKFSKLYAIGNFLKDFGKGVANWAGEHSEDVNKNINEMVGVDEGAIKEKKSPVVPSNEFLEGSDDLYEKLFGENNTTKEILGEDNYF